MSYPSIPCLKNNPSLEGQYCLCQNVVYSPMTGEVLTLILPWAGVEAREKRPLLVFVQGSGWTTPFFDYQLPQLTDFARAGFIVATVRHRDRTKGHPFPACLQDVKCAIRYLRKNALEYGIDPARVAIWGTSSGGNLALLTGLTAMDPRYETEEYREYSDRVDAVASCFAPTDLVEMAAQFPELEDMRLTLCGGKRERWQEVAMQMSPFYQVEPGKEYPAFLLAHGTADEQVPYGQMEKLYRRFLDCGIDVKAYQVDGALHEGNFWSGRIYEIIKAFLTGKE